MIRINLLPIRQTQKRQTVQQQLLIGAFAVMTTIIVCIVWIATVANTVSEKKEGIATRETELKQLEKIIGEVNEFTKKKKELEDKLNIIEQLRKSKSGPVKALDDLATEIPHRVWITELQETGGSVKIMGRAIEHEDVSAFMKALQKSKYFAGVLLKVSKSVGDKSGVTLYEFEITCSVNYSA